MSAPPGKSGSKPSRILTTSDRREIAVVVERALSQRYVCEFATDVEAAERKLAAGAYDLVLCDITAGGPPALSLAEEIARGEAETAVILISDIDDPELAEQAFDFGAYGFLVKPPWPGQLLITTMNALRRRELELAHREHSQNLEDRRQTIIDMAPIPIYAKDLDGRYIVANAKADELSGLGQGELLGLTDEAILTPEELEVGTESDRRVIDEHAGHEREDTVEIGGEVRTFKTVRFPLLDEGGDVIAVGGISVDLTAEKKANRLQEALAATQLKAIEELQLSRQETIEGLAAAIDLHDSSTGAHVARMAEIAAHLGSQLGLDPGRVRLLRAAAPMHDVGKIGTPAEILRKPGSLTEAERETMKRHAIVGFEIFARFESELSQMAATIALTHHERWDGLGYPEGLAGSEIPLEGRIVAVADVFDALLSDRSYRDAMTVEDAMAVMREGSGESFDPAIVAVLEQNLDEALACRERSRSSDLIARPPRSAVASR